MARRRHPPERPSSILSIESAFAGLLTAVTLLFHINRFCYAGGLWRDEAAAVQLARMPTLTDVLRNFQFEAFPIVFPFTIRSYTSIFGTSDVAFRFFGLMVGILMIACLWISARLAGARLPLISTLITRLQLELDRMGRYHSCLWAGQRRDCHYFRLGCESRFETNEAVDHCCID
jgi:hypothetical protein